MRKIFFLLLPIYIIPMVSAEANLTSEEYAVYSAYLNSLEDVHSSGSVLKMIVINKKIKQPLNNCSLSSIAEHAPPAIARELRPLFDDLLSKDSSSFTIARFKLRRKYAFLDENNFARLFLDKTYDGWASFYSQFPNSYGYVSLSRVSFNKDSSTALFFVSTQCGTLCGSGKYVLLTKARSTWKIVKFINCWVS